MIARIRLLRRNGVLLPVVPDAQGWSDEGYLGSTSSDGGRARRLSLRGLCSAPGVAVRHELYQVQFVSIDHATIRVPGIERVPTPEGDAAMVQEWQITPFRAS